MFWGPYFGEGGAICVPDNFLQEKNAFYQWPSSYDIPEKDELTFGQEHIINISRYEVFQILINGEDEDWACKINGTKFVGYGDNNNINSKVKN